MAKQKYYFTFGFGQKHAYGYHVIEVEDANEARDVMNSRFDKWAFQYNSAEKAGVEEFKLHEVAYAPMFEVSMFEDSVPAPDLDAGLRTLEAAILYILDCTKMMINPVVGKVDTPPDIAGVVKDPSGKVVWRVAAGRADSFARDEFLAWLRALTPEELNQTELTFDTFLKGGSHED